MGGDLGLGDVGVDGCWGGWVLGWVGVGVGMG